MMIGFHTEPGRNFGQTHQQGESKHFFGGAVAVEINNAGLTRQRGKENMHTLNQLQTDERTCHGHILDLREERRQARTKLLDMLKHGTGDEHAIRAEIAGLDSELAERTRHYAGHSQRLRELLDTMRDLALQIDDAAETKAADAALRELTNHKIMVFGLRHDAVVQ
jgi:PAS domain-containing protein